MKILKKILALTLVFALGIGAGYVSEHPVTENSRFQAFTEKLFQTEVSANALTLHYTLADPAGAGIRPTEMTLGALDTDSSETTRLCNEYENLLRSFSYSRLSRDNQLTLDMLLLYFHTRASLGENYILEEPLGPSLGIQAQLPVLLGEYAFHSTRDLSDYLKLLGTIRTYFHSILQFEEKKSQAGLFMSDATLDRILTQCRSFIRDPNSNYMDELFAQRLKTFGKLTEKEQNHLLTFHHQLITKQVIPAYQELIDGLEKLRGTGKTSRGLAYFPDGREYYQYLLRIQTGSYVPVKQIQKRLSDQLIADFRQIKALIQADSSLVASLQKYSGQISLTPEQMLKELPGLMKEDFPLLKNISYEVRQVHPSMKKFLSPAFYLTPPVDTQTPNVIYINNSKGTSSLELFGTLAHEGFPGHLYQTVSFARSAPDNIRYLITSPGYIEGWATYVEGYAYRYAASLIYDIMKNSSAAASDNTLSSTPDRKLIQNATQLAWLSRSTNLCLYSLLDIGIHYEGWDQGRTTAFLKAFGITQESAVKEIYQYIVETPGNYLKYYWGSLNFQDLQTRCRKQLGHDFNLKEFHRRIMEIGPVQFPVLEKYLFLSYA